MPIKIDNQDVERLLDGIVQATGETRSEAMRRALADRYRRIVTQARPRKRAERLRRFLAEEVWPRIPADQQGRRLSREEEEALLGIGEQGDRHDRRGRGEAFLPAPNEGQRSGRAEPLRHVG